MNNYPDPRGVFGLCFFAMLALVIFVDNLPELIKTDPDLRPPCVSRYIGERGIWIDRAKTDPKQNFCR